MNGKQVLDACTDKQQFEAINPQDSHKKRRLFVSPISIVRMAELDLTRAEEALTMAALHSLRTEPKKGDRLDLSYPFPYRCHMLRIKRENGRTIHVLYTFDDGEVSICTVEET